MNPIKVVVAGDVTVDWLADTDVDWLGVGAPNRETRWSWPNWRLRPGVRWQALGGGALLLARMVRLALEADGRPDTVLGQAVSNLECVPPTRLLHSLVEVERCTPAQGSRGPGVFRVRRALGFSGPDTGSPEPPGLATDAPTPALVVLDDAGNGYRDHPAAWPSVLSTQGSGPDPLVVLKLSAPLGGPLFERVVSRLPDTVVVVNAGDLRAEGVELSYRLSWERTARDFLWQIRHNPELRELAALKHLVVRFGLDGAIHYRGPADRGQARLWFDPGSGEDEFRDRNHGRMIGLTDGFVAALAARLTREGLAGIGEGVRDGLMVARRMFLAGFGTDERALDYPGGGIFGPPRPGEALIADAAIPASAAPDQADPDWWCLLHELRTEALETIAGRIVREGESDALRLVPVGVFGALRTVDRAEIEAYRGVQNLIGQFLSRGTTKRPLCLAVFGPPGSGKSFGVEQVAKSIAAASDVKVSKVEFNLSQFESAADLVRALHAVRDRVLAGETPLVFFDEFDCEFNGPLGWLRSFLAPMQDGVFRDGGATHPVGKAIFVFAGGTAPSFARFSLAAFDPALDAEEQQEAVRRFREAKGPDFVSRLRGHINVRGPNPDSADPDDRTWLIRRATIIRVLLRSLWPGLADPARPGHLDVDEGVLRALIGVPLYRHGVRSIEAIIETSQLTGRTSFEPSALPPADILDQHTDAQAFTRLVQLGIRFAAAREATAEAVHEAYRRDRSAEREADDPAMRPWPELDETFRRANRAQADDILRKMERIGCGFRPAGTAADPFSFRPDELERLAELEHERWVEERVGQGYTLGPERDPVRKTSPYLIPWSELSDEVRQWDRDAVAAIPHHLASAGLEIYRL